MYGHQRTDSWNSPRRRTAPATHEPEPNPTKRYSTGMNYVMDGSESSSTAGGFTTVGRATGAGFYSPPNEGNSSSEKTNRERINQIVQAFFWKATMVIIQSRMNVSPMLSAKTHEKKTNKWFNIELDEMESFREEARLWRQGDSFEPRPPPLIIETYLDTNDLTPTQALVIVDGDNKRWNVTEALQNAATRVGLNAGGSGTGHQIVLERWKVELSPPLDVVSASELPAVYKKAIILFRALYSYVSLMPTWKFRRRLAKLKIKTSALKVGCRIINGDEFARSSRRWDGLQVPLVEGEPDVTESYGFGKVESPAGQFNVTVVYRKNCNFRVDDSEALLSSQFINLDEHYFRPTGHQRTTSQPSFAAAREPGSLPSSNNAGLGQRPDYLGYGSLASFHQSTAPTSASPISTLRTAAEMADRQSTSGSPADRPSAGLRSIQGSKSSLRSIEGVGGVSRRGSISFMQPFKSPSLSASPATTDNPAGSSAGRTVPSGPVHRQRASLGTVSSSLKSAAPSSVPAEVTPSQTPIPISDSPRPQSMTRITSSFGGRRPRVASGASLRNDEDNNSSGKASYSSSTAAPGSGLNAESGGSGYDDDLNIQQFMSMIADGQKQSLKSFQTNNANDAASKRMGNALQRFQRMRDSQSALADSLSSSLVLQPSSSPSSSTSRQLANVPGMVASTAFSSSSSPGKPMSPHTPHTPAVPSRLSEGLTAQYPREQRHRRHLSSPQDVDSRMRIAGDEDEGAATTSPLDIPLSPRLFGPRRSNSMSQQREPLQGADMEFESASLDSVNMVPLSMSRLLDLRIASETGLPGREEAETEPCAQNTGDEEALAFGPPQPPSMDSAEGEAPRYQPRLPRGGGLASSGSSYRARYSTRGRGNTPPTGSTSSLERERGSGISSDPRGAFGRRTPSWSRPGEDEELLFAMSDMFARRSLEQDRGSGGEASNSSSRRRSRGGAGSSGDSRGNW